jgi:uncharacterized delta-60 repeat protein
MKKISSITLLTLVALAACATNPTTTTLETIKQPAIDTKKTQVLGILEVELSSEKGSVSSVKFVEAGNAGGLRAQGTAVPINSSNWVFTPGTTTYMTDGTYKFLQNTISIENKTNRYFENLVMYAINTSSSVGGTAFTAIKTLSGTPLTGTAASDVARSIVPTHGMINPTTVDPDKASLMLFTPAEAATVRAQLVAPSFVLSNPTVLEYGFKGKTLGPSSGFDTYYPDCPDCGKGEITWAFKFPLSLPNSSNLGKFTLRYVVVDEPGQFAMQSIEEQGAGTVSGKNFNNFNPNDILRILPGSDLAKPRNLTPLCRVKVAKSPDKYMGFSSSPNLSGSLDACFGASGRRIFKFNSDDGVGAISIQSDGKILLAGVSFRFTGYVNMSARGVYEFTLVRFDANGTLDTSFGTDGFVTTDVGGVGIGGLMAFQTDGKIVVVGNITDNNYHNNLALMRFNTNGSLDTNFGTGGTTITLASDIPGTQVQGSTNPTALKLQADGKIVVTATSKDFAVLRYDTTGHLDNSFGSGGIVTTDFNGPEEGDSGRASGVDIQVDGKIVVSGATYSYPSNSTALVRYDSNGNLDSNFGTGGKSIFNFLSSYGSKAVKIQPNGKILVLGSETTSNGNTGFAIVRFDSNGQTDLNFGLNGQFTTNILESDIATSAVVQSDGKIVIVGTSHTTFDGVYETIVALIRLDSNGSLDTSFDSDGKVTTRFDRTEGDQFLHVALQTDGKIVVAGIGGSDSIEPSSSDSSFALARYNP